MRGGGECLGRRWVRAAGGWDPQGLPLPSGLSGGVSGCRRGGADGWEPAELQQTTPVPRPWREVAGRDRDLARGGAGWAGLPVPPRGTKPGRLGEAGSLVGSSGTGPEGAGGGGERGELHPRWPRAPGAPQRGGRGTVPRRGGGAARPARGGSADRRCRAPLRAVPGTGLRPRPRRGASGRPRRGTGRFNSSLRGGEARIQERFPKRFHAPDPFPTRPEAAAGKSGRCLQGSGLPDPLRGAGSVPGAGAGPDLPGFWETSVRSLLSQVQHKFLARGGGPGSRVAWGCPVLRDSLG